MRLTFGNVIWIAAFLFILLGTRHYSEEIQADIDQEKQCIEEASGYAGMQECFKLMDRNREAREKR